MATSPPSHIHPGGPAPRAMPRATPPTPSTVAALHSAGGARAGPPNAPPWRRGRRAATPTPACRCPGRRGWARARWAATPIHSAEPTASTAVRDHEAAHATGAVPSETSPRNSSGPHEVVLLLDGQRPRVQERVDRLELGEVAVAGHDLLPVGEVEQRGHGGGAQLRRHHARASEPARRRPSTRTQEQQRREQAPGPAGPEGAAAGSAPTGPARTSSRLVMRNPDRTKKTSTPTQPPPEEAEVEGDHRRDGDAADAVERRPVPMFGHTPQTPPHVSRTPIDTLPAGVPLGLIVSGMIRRWWWLSGGDPRTAGAASVDRRATVRTACRRDDHRRRPTTANAMTGGRGAWWGGHRPARPARRSRRSTRNDATGSRREARSRTSRPALTASR